MEGIDLLISGFLAEQGTVKGSWFGFIARVYVTDCAYTRDATFPDFSGIPDFHKSKLSMKNLY